MFAGLLTSSFWVLVRLAGTSGGTGAVGLSVTFESGGTAGA